MAFPWVPKFQTSPFGPTECFEEIPQTVAVEADLVDEPGGLPNSHGDPQVTIG